MNSEPEQHSLKDLILRDIRAGKVSMRPKLYFTLQVLSLIALSVAILVVSIFIWNFIVFSIRVGSHDTLLGFGVRGWEAFLLLFPWYLLLIDAVLVFTLQFVLRHFRFGYKIPVLYLLLGLLLATVTVGFVLDRGTELNDRLSEGRGLPPPIHGWYEHAHHPFLRGSGVCKCRIVAIDGSVLTVEDTRDATTTLTVILPPDNPYATTSTLGVGDTIFIAGEEDDGVIRAFGVRKEVPQGMGSAPLRSLP